jgi:hypothetical protein
MSKNIYPVGVKKGEILKKSVFSELSYEKSNIYHLAIIYQFLAYFFLTKLGNLSILTLDKGIIG